MTLTSFLALFWQRSQENKLTQAAGSLTYSTMLAIVPLIMVVFSIFSAFPVFNEVTGALKEFIFTNFAPSASDVVGQYIDEFVHNSKKMSAVGIVSLILVALMLINSIDRTLNGIWQDTSNRPIFTSFAIYWLILTLGPLLIGTSIAASSYVKAMFEQSETLSFGLKLLSFVPFLSTWFIFTLIYMVVPNKKVSIKRINCRDFLYFRKTSFYLVHHHLPVLSINLWRHGNTAYYVIVDSNQLDSGIIRRTISRSTGRRAVNGSNKFRGSKMIALIQRVTQAKVEVEGQIVGQIGKGLLVLLGVEKEDDQAKADKLAEKVLNYRIFSDENDKMNLNVQQIGGEVLVVSQFTLSADTQKGLRPSFSKGATPALANELYDYFSQKCAEKVTVANGQFAADMQVSLTNDGPVTFWLNV